MLSFLFEGLRLSKYLDIQRTPLERKKKKIVMLATMSFFPSMLEIL
jgi:hypothetical protein